MLVLVPRSTSLADKVPVERLRRVGARCNGPAEAVTKLRAEALLPNDHT
jgi:hypothetical protein